MQRSCLPWYAADQNPAAAENAVAEEWWCICWWWVEEDFGDGSLLFIPKLQPPPTMLLDKPASIELQELFDVIELFPLLEVFAAALVLLFVTFPLQSSADTNV